MQKRRKTSGKEEPGLLCCAELILPYLDPVGLACISSTCRDLNAISKAITSRRSCDASRGLEKFPIPYINSIDSQPYAYFTYTPTQTLPSLALNTIQPFGYNPMIWPDLSLGTQDPFLFRVEGVTGCDCGICDEDTACPCFTSSSERLATQECGPFCHCNLECRNRMSQKGILVKLKIVKDQRKGWGLYAGELISKGKFVCEYAGELLVTEEARKRQQKYDVLASKGLISPALLVVKEHLSRGTVILRINIDATRIGNVARFINHSCDGGNLEVLLVRGCGALLPRVCFFAARDIQENEELSFSYGDISRLNPNPLPCFCASSSCLGILPSEDT